MAVRIFTDSTCDIPAEEAARMRLHVVPLTVLFEDGEFLDGVDISCEEFYRRLREAEKLPKTSQVPPQRFAEAFAPYIAQGDEIVGIFISAEVSGTYQSACAAKEALGYEKLYPVDSRSATMSLALLVRAACRMRDSGMGAEEIAGEIKRLTKKIRFYAAVDTLKYLKMGGRISSATAVIGGLLGIKPIVSMQSGLVKSVDKAKGHAAAVRRLIGYLKQEKPDFTYGLVLAHADAPLLLEELKEKLTEMLSLSDAMEIQVGPAIGVYAGPGCVGLSYIAQ